MTLAEILQAIEARLAQLQIVGRPLTDAEGAEVEALQCITAAMRRLRLARIIDPDGSFGMQGDPREIKPIGKISPQLGVGECDKCGTTWLATESLPCPNGCEAPNDR